MDIVGTTVGEEEKLEDVFQEWYKIIPEIEDEHQADLSMPEKYQETIKPGKVDENQYNTWLTTEPQTARDQAEESERLRNWIIQNSEDPEEEMAKLRASKYLADQSGVDPSYVYNNFAEVTKEYYGQSMTGISAWQSMGNSVRTGRIQSQLGDLYYQQLMGDASEETQAQIDDLRGQLPSPEEQKRMLPLRAVKAALEMSPMMLDSMSKGVATGLAYGTGGAATAAIGGQLGPQVAAPEELVTVPTAFTTMYFVGQSAGSTSAMMKKEAGLAYMDMMDYEDPDGNKINPDVARNVAIAIGALNGVIEASQVSNIPGINQLVRKATGKAVNKMITNGTIRNIAWQFSKQYAGNITSETAQEVLQETINIIGEEVAKNVSGSRGGDPEEIVNRLKETAVQSALAFSVMGLPGSVMSPDVAGAVREMRGRNGVVQNSDGSSIPGPDARLHRSTETSMAFALSNIESTGPVDTQSDTYKLARKQYEEAKEGNGTIPPLKVVQGEDGTLQAVDNDMLQVLLENDERAVEIELVEGPPARPAVVADSAPDWTKTSGHYAAGRAGFQARESEFRSVQAIEDLDYNFRIAFPEMEPSDRQAAVAMVEARAAVRGMDPSQYIQETFDPQVFTTNRIEGQPYKAAADFKDSGKALVHLTEQSDFSSWVHEYGHVIRRELPESDLQILQDHYQDQTWSRDTEEAFVNDFEEYLFTGKAPAEGLKELFRRVAAGLKKVFDRLGRSLDESKKLPEEVKAVFDRIFTPQGEVKADFVQRASQRVVAQEREFLFQDEEKKEIRSYLDGEAIAKTETDTIPTFPNLKGLADWVSNWFKSSGNEFLQRDDIGKIQLTKRGVKDSISHGLSKEKAQAFILLPDVIRNGKLVNTSQKGQRVGYVIAAPVRIGDQDYIELALLRKQPGNDSKLYVHEVVLKEKAQSDSKPIEALRPDGHPGLLKSIILDLYGVNNEDILLQTADENNLVAQHNLSLQNLKHAEKMGGVAAPSLSITTPETSTDDFGEITLLADPSLIDPRDRKNEVYSEDVYSPRYPAVTYDFDIRFLREETVEEEKIFPLNPSRIQDEGILALYNSRALQLKYLKEEGKIKSFPKAKKKYPARYYKKKPSAFTQDGLKNLLDIFIEDRSKWLEVRSGKSNSEYMQSFIKDTIENIKDAKDAKRIQDQSELESFLRKKGLLQELERISREINDYKEIDASALQKRIDKLIRPDAARVKFERWVDDHYSDVITGEKLFKGYTPAGKRRYSPHTLENVVNMLVKDIRGGESFHYGVNSIKAQLITRFHSLKQIKEARGELVDQETYDKSQKELEEELLEIQKMFDYEYVEERLEEAARYGIKSLDDYYKGYDADKIRDFFAKLRMAPAKYFEVKIKRAVSLREFEAALVPTGKKYDEAAELLKSKELIVRRYKDNEHRKKIIGRQKQILFQNPEHEEIIRQAVEEFKPVPLDVLMEYQDRDWAQKELRRRDVMKDYGWLLDLAVGMESWEEFKDFILNMGTENEITAAKSLGQEGENRFYQEIWSRANLMTREDANKGAVELYANKKAVMALAADIAADMGAWANKGVPGAIWTLANNARYGTATTERQIQNAIKAVKENPLSLRTALADRYDDPAEIIQLQYEQEIEYATPEKVQYGRLTTEERMKEAMKTDDPEIRKMLLTGIGTDPESMMKMDREMHRRIGTLRSQQTKEIKKLQGKLGWSSARIAELEAAEKGIRKKAKSEQEEAVLQAIQETKDRIRESLKKRNELKKIKERMRILGKSITRKPSENTHWTYKEEIRNLQEEVEGRFRRPKTAEALRKRREFYEKNPEIAAVINPEILKQINARPLNEWSLPELETLNEKINRLREEGVRKQKLIEDERKKEVLELAARMAFEIGEGKITTIPDFITTGEQYKDWKKSTAKQQIDFSILRPSRLLKGMSGEDSTLVKVFWREMNQHQDESIRNALTRKEKGLQKMKDLGITWKHLSQKVFVPGTDMEPITINEVIQMYIAQKNEKNMRAFIHGNRIRNPHAYVRQLSDNERALGDFIAEDFEAHHERYAEAYAVDKNDVLGKVPGYFPMRRQSMLNEARNDEVMRDMGSSAGVMDAYASRQSTKKRIDIGDEHQAPVRMGAMELWMEEVEKQEHYIASARYIKKLHSILKNKTFQAALVEKYGQRAVSWTEKYINEFANPNLYKFYDATSQVSRILRNNMAIAYLAYNMMTMAKQAPSLALFLGRVGPHRLVAAAGKFMINPIQALDFVNQRDPQMKERSLDRFTEELKLARKNPVLKALQDVGRVGMRPIMMIDKMATTIGWLAVYDANIMKGEQEAVRLAQEAVLETQPAARAKDLAEIYRSNEGLNWFLMFTNQVNQTWNILTADIPAAVRQGQVMNAMGMITGLMVSFAGIALISGWKPWENDEPEEFIADAAAQLGKSLANTIPVVGKSVSSGMDGWWGTGVDPVPVASETGKLIKALSELDTEDMAKQAGKVAEGMAVLSGIPLMPIKRSIKAGEKLDDRETEKAILEFIGYRTED